MASLPLVTPQAPLALATRRKVLFIPALSAHAQSILATHLPTPHIRRRAARLIPEPLPAIPLFAPLCLRRTVRPRLLPLSARLSRRRAVQLLRSKLNLLTHLPVRRQTTLRYARTQLRPLLRSDPNFGRLPAADQQRLVQQLRQVNQMPAQQRDRRLARAEAIEHMSPDERTRLNASSQRLTQLPLDRQNMVKRAFQDLRAVPEEQRPLVLNSARYQGTFTPEERGILTNLLRAEPYEAPR